MKPTRTLKCNINLLLCQTAALYLNKLIFFHKRGSHGSLGDLDGGEENTPDNLSLSGEEGGASDPDDSAEGDSSSPPPYTPLYNEGDASPESRLKKHYEVAAFHTYLSFIYIVSKRIQKNK
ncbi:hypothetical protein D9C73_007824 [Collichthys lucidus]|uniref:Uncharacterized protein n=1 Tax=Collichthys lucidus TaxID=240159 RepID=A0A4U5UGL1_COLLU|nr:hypothetical protein D9C73_007824 [Collichthys lucidus]